jgi:hypothetical protein
MKTPQKIAVIVLSILFVLSLTSCYVQVKKDNGNHKGWTKNPKNPHHPANVAQPGNQKTKGKK